jgi:pyruvate formate lyase activating enzyme
MRIGGFQKTSLIDYPGEVASIIFTQGCNFRCPYCHNPELVLPDQFQQIIDENTVLSMLNQRKDKIPAVVITGGEPTLQPDLLSFVAKIKSLGLKIKLDTNGSNPLLLKQIIKNKLVDYIAMDIKSPIEKYFSIVGSARFNKKIKESIRILISSQIKYEFRTTVVKNLLGIEDFREISEEIHGADLYILQNFKNTKSLSGVNFECYTDEQLEQISKIFNKSVNSVKIR